MKKILFLFLSVILFFGCQFVQSFNETEEESIEIVKAMEESDFHKPEECTVGTGNTEYGEFTYHAINPVNKPIQVTLFVKSQQQEEE